MSTTVEATEQHHAEWAKFWNAVADATGEAILSVSADHPRRDLLERAVRASHETAGLPEPSCMGPAPDCGCITD